MTQHASAQMLEAAMERECIQVRWHSHPAEIPAAAWVLPGARQACLCLPYLTMLQDGALDCVKSWHYATAHAGDHVVGLLVALMIEAVDAQVLGAWPLRLLVLSDAMGMCRPPLVVAGPSAAEQRRITVALLDSAIERAHTERADGVHAYWIGEGAVALREALSARGFAAIPEEPCAHVPLLEEELGIYPEALRGNYRSVIKRKLKQLGALGLSVSTKAAQGDAALLDALYTNVAERKEEERYEIVESRFSRRFFERALACSAFRLSICEKRDGTLLGYLLGMHSGDTFFSLAVGLDYARIEEMGASGLAPAVFQSVHAEALARAQAEGARWAMLGITALEGKARVGALCERNFGMGLGLNERAWEVVRLAQAMRVAGESLPACRPYSEGAMPAIARAASRRGILLADPYR